jgi:hypothetical protein
MDLRDAVNAYRAIKRSDLKATIEKVAQWNQHSKPMTGQPNRWRPIR